MRRKTVVVALLVVVGAGLVLSGLLGGTGTESAPETVPETTLIEVDGDHELWPYTSRSRSAQGRTLAINVVFRNDAERVERALTGEPGSDWQETDASERTDEFGDERNETELAEAADGEPDAVRDVVNGDWARAGGADRYS